MRGVGEKSQVFEQVSKLKVDFNDHPLTLSFDSEVGFGVIRSIDFPQNNVPKRNHTKCKNFRSVLSVCINLEQNCLSVEPPKFLFGCREGGDIMS